MSRPITSLVLTNNRNSHLKASTLAKWHPVWPTFYDPFKNLWNELDASKWGDFRDSSLAIEERDIGPKIGFDVISTDKNYVIKTEIPGMKKEDIKVLVDEDNVLTISGEKKQSFTKDDAKTKFHRVEHMYGDFTECMQLPKECDKNKITSKYLNGVLELNIEKKPHNDSKTIQIL